MIIRAATVSDASVIAQIHVGTWRVAYRGQVPDIVLAALTIERRAEFWRKRLAEKTGAVFVAEENGSVLGFCDLIPSRDANASAQVMEIGAFYIAPEHWRKGAGRALCQRALADARNNDCKTVTLWVLKTNHTARLFYERIGFALDGATKTERWPDGSPLPEVRYRISL